MGRRRREMSASQATCEEDEVRAIVIATAAGWRFRGPVVLLLALMVIAGIVRQSATTPESWTVQVGETPVALAVAARSGRVFVANSSDQSVSMLDARTGAPLATMPLGHTPTALALDEAQGRVFTLNACTISPLNPEKACRDATASLSVLDLSSGALLGTVPLGSPANLLTVDEAAGRVLVAHWYDGTVNVLDAARGRVLRILDGGPTALSLAADSRTRHAFISGIDPVDRRGQVIMLDSRTGARLHAVDVGQVAGNVVCDTRAGRVLVSSDRGLYLLDARTGGLRGRIGPPGALLAVDERLGHALIAVRGHLRVIAARNGAAVAEVDDHGTLDQWSIDGVAVDEAGSRFYVAAHGDVTVQGHLATVGRLVVLDSRTGHVRRVVALPVPPAALAVDTATRRAFIVNSRVQLATRPDGSQDVVAWLRRTLPWLPLPTSAPSTNGSVTVLDTSTL